MTSKAATSGRLHLLDGMRGLAAFAVIVDHVPSDLLRTLLPGRHLAVDFFFVLSGLVLAKAYNASLSQPGGIARFLKLRLIRLYPMYALGLIIGIAVMLYPVLRGAGGFDNTLMPISIVAGILFLPSPATLNQPYDVLFPFDPPAWSLFFEVVANTVWVFLSFTFRGRFRFALLILFVLWAGISVYFAPVSGAGWQWAHFNTGLAKVCFSFFTGVALHALMSRYALSRIPVILPLALLAFILMWPAGEQMRPVFDVVAMIAIIPVTVMLAAHAPVQGLAARTSDWLGAVSYGVYILHVPLFLMLEPAFAHLGIPATLQAIILAVSAALFTQLAISIYETPLQRALKAALVPKRTSA